MTLRMARDVFVIFTLFPSMALFAHGQMACQCEDMTRCLEEYEQSLQVSAANCRSQCQVVMGLMSGALQCFAQVQTELIQARTLYRECMEEQVGKPCISSNATASPTSRRRRQLPIGLYEHHDQAGTSPYMVLPLNVKNFMQCYAHCERKYFLLSESLNFGRGGMYGYPGCASMFSCVLVQPPNRNTAVSAQVKCNTQNTIQTELATQAFCHCLKSSIGTDSQFLNCESAIFNETGNSTDDNQPT